MRGGTPSDDRCYRPGVGMMLLDQEGRVFVARRADTAKPAWQMPQGGIDEGEYPRAACLRELREETGTNRATILAESRDWLYYDLPSDIAGRVWDGRYRGQRQKWFCLRFTGSDADFDLDGPDAEFSAWKWVAATDLPALIVPFKRVIYERVIAEFEYILG